MDKKIKEILEDLFKADQGLRKKETELTKLIRMLISERPSAEIDKNFQARLREKLLSRMTVREEKTKTFFSSWFDGAFARGLAGAVALVVIVGVTVTINRGLFFPKKPALVVLEKQRNGTLRNHGEKNKLAQAPLSPDGDQTANGPRSELMDKKKTEKPQLEANRALKKESSPEFNAEDESMSREKKDDLTKDQFVPQEAAIPSPGALNTETKAAGQMKMAETPSAAYDADILFIENPKIYSDIGNMIRSGKMPSKNLIQPDAWVNYFSFRYPAVKKQGQFGVYTEISQCLWNSRHQVLLLAVWPIGPNRQFTSLGVRVNLNRSTDGGPDLILQQKVQLPVRSLSGTETFLMELDSPAKFTSGEDAMITIVFRSREQGVEKDRTENHSVRLQRVSFNNASENFRFDSIVKSWCLLKSGQTGPENITAADLIKFSKNISVKTGDDKKAFLELIKLSNK